jgi:hypothetical protein
MKIRKLLQATLIVLGVIGFAPIVSAQTIVGSAHDMRGLGPDFPAGGGEICVVCHAPHNNQNAATELLWNRASTAEVFITYSSDTFDGGAGGRGTPAPQPSGTSLQCLSCHDGTLAVDAYGQVAGTTLMDTINSNADFGTDLSNDHPISIPIAGDTDGNINTSPTGLPLFSGDIECGTCHDVHNEDAVAGTPLLYIDNSANSALCQECHQK